MAMAVLMVDLDAVGGCGNQESVMGKKSKDWSDTERVVGFGMSG